MSVADHPNREERLERMLRRLGGRNPACVSCGEDDPRCLELHHPTGRKFSDDVVCICRNCHRKVSDDQKDHPSNRSGLDMKHLTQIRKLLGRADLFRLLAEQDESEAISIFEQAKQLKETQS